MTRRTLPLALTIPVSAGSDPDVLEIEDCKVAYGEDFPPTDSTCNKSHTGQHIYSRDYFNWRRCTCCHEDDE